MALRVTFSIALEQGAADRLTIILVFRRQIAGRDQGLHLLGLDLTQGDDAALSPPLAISADPNCSRAIGQTTGQSVFAFGCR